MGRGWRLSYDTELRSKGASIEILQADGTLVQLRRTADGTYRGASLAHGQVVALPSRAGTEHRWTWADGRRLDFDTSGRLVQIVAPTGEFVSLQRDPRGWLVKVTDPQGRSLQLNYLDQTTARADAGNDQRFRGVQSIDSPVGRFTYHYNDLGALTTQAMRARLAQQGIDAAHLLPNLVRVELPSHYDATRKAHAYAERGISTSAVSRLYHYEDPRWPTLLTGITVRGQGTDGQLVNQRISTWAYDAQGRANRPQVAR
jgi:YD repeat-containing protein